jgi:hypothetical protein
MFTIEANRPPPKPGRKSGGSTFAQMVATEISSLVRVGDEGVRAIEASADRDGNIRASKDIGSAELQMVFEKAAEKFLKDALE